MSWDYPLHNMNGHQSYSRASFTEVPLNDLSPHPQEPEHSFFPPQASQVNTSSRRALLTEQSSYNLGPNMEYSGSYWQHSAPAQPYADSPRPAKKSKRCCCCDIEIILLLLTVWILLTISCVVPLLKTRSAAQTDSKQGELLTIDEIARIIFYSTIPVLFGTILNEVFVEKCWKRVQYYALDKNLCGRKLEDYTNAKLARHLRAANFSWYKFCGRVIKRKLSFRDLRSLLSWLWLRLGTALAIASTQFCVSWQTNRALIEDGAQPLYSSKRRYYLIFLPVFIHSVVVFTIPTIWLKFPWTLFSDRYNDRGFWDIYRPYLNKVDKKSIAGSIAGSIADCDDIADFLQGSGQDTKALAKKNQPGRQFRAKLFGSIFGILFMFAPAAFILWYTTNRPVDRSSVLRTDLYRFVFYVVFLAQNILYIVALDFIVWNISLESLCRPASSPSSSSPGGPSPAPKSRKGLRLLGEAAGLTMLRKAWMAEFYKVWSRQRPTHAVVFAWLFWLQACTMRALIFLWIFGAQVLSYGSIDYRRFIFYPNFWYGWLVVSAATTLPLYVVWLLWPWQAPVCDQDGWRWASIMRNRYSGSCAEAGYYGVARGVVRNSERNSEFFYASWGPDVKTFNEANGRLLN